MFHQFSSNFYLSPQAQADSADLSDLNINVDLAALRYSLMANVDPQRKLCQFEIPGGGVCKDSTFRDMHLRELEPSGERLPSFRGPFELCSGGFATFTPLIPVLLLSPALLHS